MFRPVGAGGRISLDTSAKPPPAVPDATAAGRRGNRDGWPDVYEMFGKDIGMPVEATATEGIDEAVWV